MTSKDYQPGKSDGDRKSKTPILIKVGTTDFVESLPLEHQKSLKTVAALPRFLKGHGRGDGRREPPLLQEKDQAHLGHLRW
jgi:hypothetical protein